MQFSRTTLSAIDPSGAITVPMAPCSVSAAQKVARARQSDLNIGDPYVGHGTRQQLRSGMKPYPVAS